jgi:RNA polymerase sigma-70 factor (ECF subfamily)
MELRCCVSAQTERKTRATTNPANVEFVARQDHRLLTAVARRLTRDPTEAADLMQDAFERAMRSAPVLGADDLRCWIIAVMHNLSVDRFRQRQSQKNALAALAVEKRLGSLSTPKPQDDFVDWYGDLRTAIDQLEPHLRKAFELRASDMSLSEMATTLGVPTATAATRVFRARRRLRRMLGRSTSAPSAGAEEKACSDGELDL